MHWNSADPAIEASRAPRAARGHRYSGGNRKSVDSAAQHRGDMFAVFSWPLNCPSRASRLRAQAYRKRVLETHPDKAPVKTAANADAFAELQAAYALIRDEDVRRQFDLQMRIGRYGPVNAATATRCGRDVPAERSNQAELLTQSGIIGHATRRDPLDDHPLLCVTSVGTSRLSVTTAYIATPPGCDPDRTRLLDLSPVARPMPAARAQLLQLGIGCRDGSLCIK